MPWNPEIYNQFKDIRYKPFFDLVKMISEDGLQQCIDIGCGTGEQTSLLSKQFTQAVFTGIDSSPQMLAKSKELESSNLSFQLAAVEDLFYTGSNKKWDLIFSNAALQWSDDHVKLFPSLISQLNHHGQFAVQMPVQNDNLLNKLLLELVQEKPFADYLQGWKRASPVLSMDAYAQLMFDGGLNDIQVIQKVYPIIADNEESLFNFISGSALIPYIERLAANEQTLFIAEYKSRIKKAFKKFPAIYAFKRLLLYGRKKNSTQH